MKSFITSVLKHAFPFDFFQPKKLRLFHQVWPYTMVGYSRLDNAYRLAREVERKKIPGAIVECGSWKGGCSAVMAHEVKTSMRNVYLFDSFQGLPPASPQDGREALEYAKGSPKCKAAVTDVQEILFQKLHLNKSFVHIVPGWFEETLSKHQSEIGPIALLRLDGDWYESTKICLETLYDQVVPGGYVIIDDYGHWEGCKKAVDEFFQKRNLSPKLEKIDYTGYYFVCV